MSRAWLVLIAMCIVNGAQAETRKGGHKVELQVGAPLRMSTSAEPVPESFSLGDRGTHRTIEPSFGAFSSLSQVLNTDGGALVDAGQKGSVDPGMVYSVTRSLSLGIRYNFIEAEDLAGDLAVAGTLDPDHHSHHVVLRAKWHFR